MASSAAAPSKPDMAKLLQRVTDAMSKKYKMSIAASFYSAAQTPPMSVAVASGFTDSGLGMGAATRVAQPEDLYVWGSTTKMFTASAVLQLVESGKIGLEDAISQHVDPYLRHAKNTTLEAHFGSEIQNVKIHHLLHMTSGIPDYDGERYARDQFANRTRDFGPVEIVLQYVNGTLEFQPGTSHRYCSTNYCLLALALASHQGPPWDWRRVDQKALAMPAKIRSSFPRSLFVDHGSCEEWTQVHGFMQSYSTAKLKPQDVWNMSCVGGWTAGNYLGSVADVAKFSYDLYSPKSTSAVVSAASRAHMINFTAPQGSSHRHHHHAFKFYGMGTFSLDWAVGDAEAYGHVGDTYGYQSQTTYFPGKDFALAVATNVETTSQAPLASAP